MRMNHTPESVSQITNLKPCKCSGINLYVNEYKYPSKYYRVACVDCGWTGCVGQTRQEAMELWNELEPTG